MKLRYLIAASLLASSAALAWAVPADQRVRTMTNPDGTTVQLRVIGDEHFSYFADPEYKTIFEKNASGFFVPAVRDGVTLSCDAFGVDVLRAEAEDSFAMQDGRRKVMARMASLDTQGRSTYPSIGDDVHGLVVLLEFSDTPFFMANPKEQFTRMLNEEGYSDYGSCGSARDYYIDNSNGKFKPVFDVVGPVKLAHEASWYPGSDEKYEKFHIAIKEALTALHDAGEVDFSKYDLDNNGTVDNIFFYYSGFGAADSNVLSIWPHQGDYVNRGGALSFDGKRIRTYACGNERMGRNPNGGSEPWLDGIGTFVHEYGHVLGFPDLYDVYNSGTKLLPGSFDVMGHGSYNDHSTRPPHLSAYERWCVNWMEFEELTEPGEYSFKAIGQDFSEVPKAYRVAIPKVTGTGFQHEYFVIEARAKDGWDKTLPEADGVMVWHINYDKNVWSQNYPNSKGHNDVMFLYAANGDPLFAMEGSKALHAIYPEGKVELTPFKYYSNWESPYITSIAYDKESMTGSFHFNVINGVPDFAPVLSDDPFADETGARNFTIQWEPVAGADGYMVTIKRVSTGNILSGYDDLYVGNVKEAKIMSVPVAYWNNEISATVRAVKGVPSSKTSNEIVFTPKNLRKASAVEGVNEDVSPIYGVKGAIVAPEGAVAYNLAGQRVSLDGLSAGVYVVLFNGKASKVTVK